MKKIASLLLCMVMICSLFAFPVTAAIFQVSYYEESIYAGGIMDLYAFPDNSGVEPYTYQWQYDVSIGDGHWYDLEENGSYKGTKTNHLQLYTHTGEYKDWDQIPFQCIVTDAEGTSFCTPTIYMNIYPTSHLIPNLKNWGYGLYEPTITNVTGLYTGDYVNYTASAYSGSKLNISCGSTPVEDRAVLQNSEVKLTRQIHITENGHTTMVGDQTTYIPYTVGTNAVTVEIKLKLTIGEHDLGFLETKTVRISTAKPTVVSTASTNTACSLLRYTYNESQKLASIPKGATVEVLGKDGSYYQVFYGGFVGYIGTSLLNVQTPSYDPVIKDVNVVIPAPVAGEKPSFTCNILTEGCQLYKTEPVTWFDKTAERFLTSADTFQQGHSYSLAIWLSAKSGYKFQVGPSGNPKLTGTINGNLPPFIYTAYEQDPEKVIELAYTFNNVQEAPEPPHICSPVLVKRVDPTCTQSGQEAYYHCECGMNYRDSQGQSAVDVGIWGKIPAAGHTPSGWRTTQIVHYKACTTCGDFLEEYDHSGGTATCTQSAKCTACGISYGEPNGHRWSPTFLYQDSAGHAWICADCKIHSEIFPHIPGPAGTDIATEICRDCGYAITSHTHTLTKVPQTPATCVQEGNIEYYTCSSCSDRFTDAAGSNKIPASMSVAVGALGHTASDHLLYDEAFHWRVCTVCSEVLIETKMLHDGQAEACLTCGYSAAIQPETPTATQPATPTAPQQKPTLPPPQKDPTVPPADQPSQEQTPVWNQKAPAGMLTAVLIGAVSFSAAITATVIILKK